MSSSGASLRQEINAVFRNLKRACFSAAKSAGVFDFASSSHFRNARVLVMGYHGVSLDDEHHWDPCLYLSAEMFVRRMRALKESNCTVLELEEALRLSKSQQLPERAVVLTFDDGTYDFYKMALPILKEFGFPATLYLTTYYVDFPYPVTPGIWSYMLWKTVAPVLSGSEILGTHATFDLNKEIGRARAFEQIVLFANSQGMEADERNDLSARLARALGLDFDWLCDSRRIQLLRPREIHRIAQDGVSIQMHMHRHTTPPKRDEYIANLSANRERITQMAGSMPTHFCYPSGEHTPESVNWLRDFGVQTATTCDVGLWSHSTEPLLIPRLIDTSLLPDVVFESWIVGVGALVSRLVPW